MIGLVRNAPRSKIMFLGDDHPAFLNPKAEYIAGALISKVAQ
jgi:hypothetical protein